jgi:hypothetical protein
MLREEERLLPLRDPAPVRPQSVVRASVLWERWRNGSLAVAVPAAKRGRKKQRLSAQMRACLLWALAFFAAAHIGILIATQSFWPHLRDPEFGYKLDALRKSRAEEPDRPLLLLLGTSRTGQGIRPGAIPDLRTPDGRTPLVFNFSQVGSGALAELVTLRRLLDAGIRPNWLAIEILPALLGRAVDVFDAGTGVCRLNWRDVQQLSPYAADPMMLKRRWCKDQLSPWYAHRFSILNHYVSDFLPWRLRLDHWKQLDRWGWSDIGQDDQPLVMVAAALEVTRMTYYQDLHSLRISSMEDHALRDLLTLCRKEDIPTVLYLMPEGSLFRGWYAPEVNSRINDYLIAMSREYSVPIVDLRLWMEDKYFGDSHHLYRAGASLFTRRFGPEVLSCLVQGKPEAMPALMSPLAAPYLQEQTDRAPLVEGKPRPANPAPPTLSINRPSSAAERGGETEK